MPDKLDVDIQGTELIRSPRLTCEMVRATGARGSSEGQISGTLKSLIRRAEENTLRNLRVDSNLALRILDLDDAITLLATNLTNPDPLAPAFFLQRAHAAILAAYRLVLGGQAVESFAVTRTVVETCLYGFFLSKDNEAAKNWLKRDESEDHKKWVRNTLSYGATRDFLLAADSESGGAAAELYERCISYGGHPNPAGHLTSTSHSGRAVTRVSSGWSRKRTISVGIVFYPDSVPF